MKQSIVYFIPLKKKSTVAERVEAIKSILSKIDVNSIIPQRAFVAVKFHVGEKNNNTHVCPQVVREVVKWVKQNRAKPFLTETSTLYRGERANAVDHLLHAYNHGFTAGKVGAPFIMADGLLGNTEIEIPIPGKIFKSVNIAREVVKAQALIAISHPTGHMVSGLGACIKNLGMGLSSRKGKMKQHSSIKPIIKTEICTFCKLCIKWCPQNAIIEKGKKAFIIQTKCIGCGECLSVCNFDAVAYNWAKGSKELQQSMTEHALGAIIDKKEHCLFINVLANMTKDCDCIGHTQTPIIPDIGILCSRDPVAIDQATLDLTKEANFQDLSRMSYPSFQPEHQLIHGEQIGLGNRNYKLVK